MRRLLLTLLLPLLVSGALCQTRIIPAFEFPRMDNGKAYRKADLPPGKKSLIIFFDTECPHCMQALSTFNDQQAQLNSINLMLVTKDRRELVNPFLENFCPLLYKKKNAVVVADTRNQFITLFKPMKYPSMFLFNAKGELMKYSDEEKDIPDMLKLIRQKP